MIDLVERLRSTAEMFELAQAPRHTVLHMRAAADEIERLRAALETIDHGWENPMDDKAWRALAQFMWKTARAALAQEARDDH